MSVLPGFKKVIRSIKTSNGYAKLSQWTSSQTVEMDDGATLESQKNKWDEAYEKKHIHSNQPVLDTITPTMINHWNSAIATGICHTAQGTTAKIVSCPGFTLYDGARIMITFANGSGTNYMTLDVNGTGGIMAWFPIGGNRAYNNEAISRIIVAGCAYEFIFQDAAAEKDKKWVYCGATGLQIRPEDIGAVSNDQVIIGMIDNGIASENLASYGISANNTAEEIFHMLPRCSITYISSNVQTNIFANSLPVSKGCLALYKDGGGTRGWAEFHKYDDTMVYYAKFHDAKMSAWSTNYLPLNGNAVSATKLATARSIFGQNFDGTSNVAGKGVFNGKYNASPSSRFTTSALEIRENGLVEDSQTDIGYAPTIAFHWSKRRAATLLFDAQSNKFYFRNQNGVDRATIDANLSGNSTTATKATQDGNGNVITDTYVKKSGDTVTGNLQINGYLAGEPITSDSHNHALLLGHNRQDYCNFYEYGGVFNFYKSQSGNDTLLGKITGNGWEGNFNGDTGYLSRLVGKVPSTSDSNNIANGGSDRVIKVNGIYIANLYSNCAVFRMHYDDAVMGLSIGANSLNHSNDGWFIPESDGGVVLGDALNRWKVVYAATGTIQTSDRNLKKDENEFDEDFVIKLVTGMIPKTYKLKENDSDRTHYGFIAQDVEELLPKLGITSKDMAAFIKTPNTRKKETAGENGEVSAEEEVIPEGEEGYGYRYSLRYQEFISPLYAFCQILYRKIQEQKNEINVLKETVKRQQDDINRLKEMLNRALNLSQNI